MKPLAMKLQGIIVLITVGSFLFSDLSAQKKPLTINDIESWNRITETVISPDGKWIAYKTEPWVGNSNIYLCNNKGERRFEAACGRDIMITDDSEYLLFTIVPDYELARERKLNITDSAVSLHEDLGIFAIGNGIIDTIHNIRNSRIPGKWSGCVAYQTGAAALDPECSGSPADGVKRESAVNGYSLHLRWLGGGQTVTWPFVTEYLFSDKPGVICFASTGDNEGFPAGVYRYDCETGQTDTVMKGRNRYRRLTLSGDGKMVAFLAATSDSSSEGDFSLFLWSGTGAASAIVNNTMKGIPASWKVSGNGAISFSDDGRRIFFGIAPVRPVRNSDIPDDEYPGVDVWYGGEGLLHTAQLVNRESELRRTYLTMYDIPRAGMMRIETEDFPESEPVGNGNAENILIYTGLPYEFQSMYDPLHYDICLLNLESGVRQQVKENSRSLPRSSPSGEYLLWFNYDDYSWYTHHIKSGREFRITEPGTLRAETETNTTFDVNEPYGSPGWLDDDSAVLIYDRYDIWRVDPQNQTPPVNLTVNGRMTETVFRLIDFRQQTFSTDDLQYLTGVNENTMASGYYKWIMKKPSQPQMLIGGDYSLSVPLKAERAATVVYTRETFGVFPDLMVSDLGFRSSIRISDANPQQKEFNWGTAELYEWTSLDGREMRGMLFKPGDFDPSKKYPMIVTFFHKSSGELYSHRIPEYHRSRIDYHTFTSNGYLVFNPDIWFDPGYIGESAYKSIMPGVTALIGEGFVDPARIGAAGHSYSGYQLAYIATRTDLFACIEAGAPVVNFFSAYGGIRWETGRSRAAQYEHDQTLATIWEAPLRFLENSPLFAMDKVTTPVLIMHNDGDGAVPWYQGIEYFIALRRMNKPVWLLNYNGEPHSLTQLRNRKDFQIRLKQFFDHYLKSAPMPEWMRRGVPAVEKDYNLGY
jgi:dipeptidyl aminopeptidase/acylaminoacyl peptidase